MEDAAPRATLVAVMEEAGPPCTSTDTAFQDVLKHLPAPTEQAVAEVLGMVARTSAEGAPAWNVGVLVDGLQGANPALDWGRVAEHLDSPGFSTPDAASLAALMAAWRHATPDPFPLRALVSGLWANTAGQLSLLRQATAAPPEVLSWGHADRRQEPLEGLHAGKSPTGTANMCWMALDLYATLAALADSGHAPAVRAILEAPLKACPEILLLGAASVTGGWGPLQAELVDALVATYVAPHPNSGVVLQRLWPLNSQSVVRAMTALHAKDPAAVARCLDVCQELKALAQVLDATSPPFSLELAALAGRREYLNLEKWLGEQCAKRGVAFMQAAVSFLDAKLRADDGGQAPGSPGSATALPVPRLSISVEALAVFLRVLAANAAVVPTDTLQQLKLVQAVAVQAHPELAAVVADAGSMEAFPADVEEEANATFQRVYSGDLTVDELVAMLRGYRNSTLGREQEVFACMVHNLFDEFRFFSRYPDKELATTAQLFGQLVAHGLVSSVSLGIALRYVLDALRGGADAAGSKMFRFGVEAACQFSAQLDQYPAFAGQLAALPGVKEFDPELHAAAESAVTKAAAASSAAADQAAAAAAAAAAAPPPRRSAAASATCSRAWGARTPAST